MRRKLVILKVGITLSSLFARRGDFEDWILAGMNANDLDPWVLNVPQGDALPVYGGIGGIVITGSHAMVTEHHGWSDRTAEWVAGAVGRGIPVLGICYGHQLLAYALGGEIGDNPDGPEFGTVKVHLDEGARKDALLGGFSTPIQVQVSHMQSVLRLPPKAQRLAYSAEERNQAFVVGNCAWGVQFHPEFNAEISRAYIHEFEEVLLKSGQKPSELAAQTFDTSDGVKILKRFAAIVEGKDSIPIYHENMEKKVSGRLN